MKNNFKERIFEIAFGDNAINKDYSEDEVISKLMEFSDNSLLLEDISYNEIEYIMDKANGMYGEKDNLCLFCHAKEYNGKVGVVHHPKCMIQRLRDVQ